MSKKHSWREFGLLFGISFGVIAPFLLLTQVSRIRSTHSFSAQNWRQIFEAYATAYFAIALGSFTFCFLLSVVFGFLKLMLDKVPPPYPLPSENKDGKESVPKSDERLQ